MSEQPVTGNPEADAQAMFSELQPLEHARVGVAHGIAAIALNMAIKYHDIGTVQDGTLYQQYKLEGRNMTVLHLDMVFETAMRIEAHLMGSSQRIASMVIDALAAGAGEEAPVTDNAGPDAQAR